MKFNRNSLTYVSYKDRKQIAADLKPIYTAISENEALFALEEFAEKWNSRYPIITKSWQANWQRINPMFQFPQEVRRAIYTTNVIESLNYSLRKITKTQAAFPIEEAAIKLLWLGLRNIEKKLDNADTELESGNESNGDHFRGKNADSGTDGKSKYTKFLTAPIISDDFLCISQVKIICRLNPFVFCFFHFWNLLFVGDSNLSHGSIHWVHVTTTVAITLSNS